MDFDVVGYVLQPLFSPSALCEMIRPEGSSSISVLNGESLTAELAHELMAIQVTSELFNRVFFK